jgi:hypothetical protein
VGLATAAALADRRDGDLGHQHEDGRANRQRHHRIRWVDIIVAGHKYGVLLHVSEMGLLNFSEAHGPDKKIHK